MKIVLRGAMGWLYVRVVCGYIHLISDVSWVGDISEVVFWKDERQRQELMSVDKQMSLWHKMYIISDKEKKGAYEGTWWRGGKSERSEWPCCSNAWCLLANRSIESFQHIGRSVGETCALFAYPSFKQIFPSTKYRGRVRTRNTGMGLEIRYCHLTSLALLIAWSSLSANYCPQLRSHSICPTSWPAAPLQDQNTVRPMMSFGPPTGYVARRPKACVDVLFI